MTKAYEKVSSKFNAKTNEQIYSVGTVLSDFRVPLDVHFGSPGAPQKRNYDLCFVNWCLHPPCGPRGHPKNTNENVFFQKPCVLQG